MPKAHRGEQALRQHIRFLGFQKCAGCATFLQKAQPVEQECSSKSPMPKFWASANHANLTNEMFTLTAHDLLEFALTERPKSSGRTDHDQVEVRLIRTGLVILHTHADAIKHGLMQLLVGIKLCLRDAELEGKAFRQRDWKQWRRNWMNKTQVSFR
jgi:hypothetical protein